MAVGFWAWTEKDVFNNISKVTTIALDPAFILICSGTITFIIGFTGCVGALRENTCLLAAVSLKLIKKNLKVKGLKTNIHLSQYSIFLVILLLIEMGAGILVFVLKDKGWVSFNFNYFVHQIS